MKKFSNMINIDKIIEAIKALYLQIILKLKGKIKKEQAKQTSPVLPPISNEQVPRPASPQVEVKSMRIKIHEEAIKWLGKDASPRDLAPDELACVESVCRILQRAGVDVPLHVSTIKFNRWLRASNQFKGTLDAKPGNIIISVTGTGNGSIIGHTGIFYDEDVIMSNNS